VGKGGGEMERDWRRFGKIPVFEPTTLQADSKVICAVGILQISRHSIVFRSPKQIPLNALPVFETTPEVIQPSRVFLRCSGAIIKRGSRSVFVDSNAMVKADGEAIRAVSIPTIRHHLEEFIGCREIDCNSNSILQKPSIVSVSQRREPPKISA
jgi:hypothetical protein